VAKLFISQDRLDAWTVENRIEIEGELMTLLEDGRRFTIQPAVRFLKVAGGDPDPHDLLGKVKDEESLALMGADLMMSSVIYVDTAYDVQTGFLGTPVP
jgi:hypothetical protein